MTASPELPFPCDYTFKFMGLNDASFKDIVLNTLTDIFGDIKPAQITLHPSKNEKYVSVNVTVHAQERALIDQAYQTSNKNPKVLMAL